MRLINRISFAFCFLVLTVLAGAQPNTTLIKPVNDMMGRVRKMKLSGSFDSDFARLMVEHHQAAIEMAQAYLAGGNDAQLKAHARQLIEKRKKEQKQLDIFTMSKGGEGSQELMGGIDQAAKQMNGTKSTGDIDRDFAMMMMAHHDSGTALAQKEMVRGQNAALKKLAANLAEDNRQGKELLNQWLSAKSK